ncbi:hypothetical protein L810_1312 [Burkholderia sp. AU4i]|nr:hypothetical protein L810_1312 [Burkholderia sp. AU4i]
MDLSIKTPKLSSVCPKPGKDAHLFRHGRLGMLGDSWC